MITDIDYGQIDLLLKEINEINKCNNNYTRVTLRSDLYDWWNGRAPRRNVLIGRGSENTQPMRGFI